MTIFVNNKAIKCFNFSGGECHVQIDHIIISELTRIDAYVYSADDIMGLIMTVDAVRQIYASTLIDLYIPYLPYARQDRVCNPGEAFGALVMADLINRLECNHVYVMDPHSSVSVQALSQCVVIEQAQIIKESVLSDFIMNKKLALVSPDKGARIKTKKVADTLLIKDIFYCSKVRDSATGKITHSSVDGIVHGRDLIILDDICDGGRTFTELAKILKAQGAKELYLYVTHGIFSKGLEILRQDFKHVFCYHTFLPVEKIDTEFLTVMRKGESHEN